MSIKEYGFQQPIVVDKSGIIITGHTRLKAAVKLGMKTCPVIVAESLSDAQIKAYRIADNKTGELATWDDELLAVEIQDLVDMNFDIELTGFDLSDFDLDKAPGLTPDDAVPEVEESVSKLGDLWTLGNHRILCGDSTDIKQVERLMDGEKADMVFTDPPYNVASDFKNFASDVSKSMNDLKNSEWDKGFSLSDFIKTIPTVCDGGAVYVWTSHFLFGEGIALLGGVCDFSSYLVWSKPNPMPSLSKRHPTWNTELCLYGTIGSDRIVNFPENGHFLSCREVVKKSDGSHPTQKPIELIEPLLVFSSGSNALVYDGFLGSGSTLIACEKTNRKCYGMELDPHYCDVIVKRWEDYTGQTAVLKED